MHAYMRIAFNCKFKHEVKDVKGVNAEINPLTGRCSPRSDVSSIARLLGAMNGPNTVLIGNIFLLNTPSVANPTVR